MKVKEILKATQKLNRNKYHICIKVQANYEDDVEWVIFRKDMPLDIYFSNENKPILSSENNTDIELKEFIRRNK